MKFVYRDGQFVSSATAYFPDATTANTFYAYYPYNQTGFRSNTSSLAVAVATDQSDAASRTASDWMVAVTRNVKPDGQAVPVAFRHILSLMQIRMTAGDGVTADELLEAEVLLKDFCSTALYDVDAETFGEPADVTDIRPYGTTRIEGDYVTGLSAVVVPQTREAGETVIYFTFKGKTMAYKPSSEFTFEPGKSHLFTATIGMTPQGPTLAVSAQIDDWQEGGVITGDASKPELPSVSDYDGNTYPVIEINGVKWLAANLRTTHYNDGTEIPVVDGGTDAWDALTAPAACITENNADYREKYGLLYNFYTVATGKLCPEGWTVPDWEQTDALPYGSIAQNVALMAPDDNWTALASDPTNTTGFSALPGGNSSWAFWERGSAYFWTSYTSDSGPASFTLGGTTMISQSYYESAGLSVRCIKKAEPEPEPEPAATVKDIDGNEYPVVEIGGLTWMAANLKTLHLNDGTEIPIGKGQEASWDTFTTPTACDFMDKTENRATYGLLYNFYTVDTGKICPEGWTVPDWDQMQSLLDAVPKAADLMAPDSRWNHYNPTNASGFGALPGGIQSYYYWLTSDAGIWTSYKGDNSPGYLYLSNMPYIAQSYLYSGMYVRCIKSTNTSDL